MLEIRKVDDLLEAFLDEPDRLPTEAGKKCHCCYQWDTFREAPQWVYKKIPAKVRFHIFSFFCKESIIGSKISMPSLNLESFLKRILN